MLSDRIQRLSPSLTIAITTMAQDLRKSGKDVISFSAGEPDFGTPRAIKDAAFPEKPGVDQNIALRALAIVRIF